MNVYTIYATLVSKYMAYFYSLSICHHILVIGGFII